MEYQDAVLEQLKAQTRLLKRLADLATENANPSPGYRRQLHEYPTFDWASIGAKPVAFSGKEIVEVEWNGHRFHRATGEKFNSKFMLFSRPSPDWSAENKKYFVLIRFYNYGNADGTSATG